MVIILEKLGFKLKKEKKFFRLLVPSWRPDIVQEIDIVEELVRISGYEKIKKINPIKERSKNTLNPTQKLFHFLQRAVASKGYLEAITWSFTDSKYNDHFKEACKEIKIVNPISSELGVLRNSIFSNLVMYMSKNLDRGIKFLSIFDITPTKSCTLIFLLTINAKSLSDFWKSDTEYFGFWSFKDFFGNFKLSRNISNPTKESVLTSNVLIMFGWISPK